MYFSQGIHRERLHAMCAGSLSITVEEQLSLTAPPARVLVERPQAADGGWRIPAERQLLHSGLAPTTARGVRCYRG